MFERYLFKIYDLFTILNIHFSIFYIDISQNNETLNDKQIFI